MKIAFILPEKNQDILIKSLNAYLDNNHDVDIIGLTSNLNTGKSRPEFAVLNISEGFGLGAVCLVTDMYSAFRALSFPGLNQIFYYLTSVEWGKFVFEENVLIFNNPRINIIADSLTNKVLVETFWNKQSVDIVEDYNIQKLIEVMKKCQSK